jgi:hypothetical protein
MKKIIFLFIFLFSTILTFSQDFNKVVRASKCEFINDKWVTVQTEYPEDYFVIIEEWNITIGKQKFKTYDSPEKTYHETHVCYTWKCVNKDGEKVLFLMKKFKPEISSHMLFSILYPNHKIMFEYETE